MISLEDLKNIIKPKNADHSNLEFNVMYWIEHAEVLNYDLAEDEILYGLSHYLDHDTIGLWRKYLTERTLKIYTKLGEHIPLVDSLLQEALSELKNVRATVHISDNSKRIVFEESFDGQLIQYSKTQFTLDDKFANVLDFNKGQMSYPVSVAAHQNFLVSSLNSNDLETAEDYVLTSLEMIKNSIAISLVVMSLSSISAMAGDNSGELKEALQSSTKAFAKTETGADLIHRTKIAGNIEIKNFKKENPNAEIPVAVLGYGLKVLKDKGVKLKTKNDTIIDDTTYEILVGKEMEVSMSGKNQYADKSTYKLAVQPDKVYTTVTFDVDW